MPCLIKLRDSLAITGNYRKEFLEQLANMPSDTRARIEKFVFEDLPGLSSITRSGKVEKIKGYDTYYKARFGAYRVCTALENDTLILRAVMDRKDIYKIFP
uniref:mRNA interferase RelE/StbE n=1 Tax=Candidatus Kentrum sp. SD TaxID=2126332 RepID=A0A450YHB7_9GAMM|nr:MAG: mRNA interferase RelE/StbE [Candidatus Kentron sp. SD]VFK48743.1 MAG: mRNA interferase RelE/StbE [Candidatus Kentron sp. SD]